MLDFFDSKLYIIPDKSPLKSQGDVSLVVLVNGVESKKNKAFIQSVLKSFDFHLEHFILMFCSECSYNIKTLKSQYAADFVLCFDLRPAMLGLQVKENLYQSFSIMNTRVVFLESLDLFLLEKEKAEAATSKIPRPKARQLWESLKIFFKSS